MAPDDTAPEVAAVLLAGWRQMAAPRRMALVDAWSRDVRALAEAGVRARQPDADEAQVRLDVARLLYGEEVIDEDVEQAARTAG